ncbi:acyl-CoA dehydrogenase family protein [Alkalimarinus coralli]|uniref:acyl-CoA dehydrogenase family protein n=1 Tax=Alkalimarinus coralli TaxID=2935863 RepID=UPI00202B2F77|nr:acyl-CoA dehydrogenase family protein [Alkalimarinus coralli]
MDFNLSERAQDYLGRVKSFMEEDILPVEDAYFKELKSLDNPWVVLPVIKTLKEKAKAQGLWNLFLPVEGYGPALSNAEYAPIAEQTGRSFIAPEIFNCNAPDTGNMEVLVHYGSEQQKEQWLTPLLEGKIRSAFCMTEPGVASSDATNMEATAIVEGDEVVLNGRKWWSTGIGHPDCEILVFMGLTNPDAHRHQRHSMVLVPKNTPGVKVERMLPVFGDLDEPYGHGEVSFTDVRLPKSAIIAGPGRGFEIAQGRLGPGRIHHCMRAIGASERALELLIKRAVSREAFGQPLAKLGGNRDIIANARMSIEQARLLTMKAAWTLDTKGIMGAMSDVSQIKVVAPNVLQTIVDQAMQIHGGAGMSEDFPLTQMYAYARCLRLADGPDEVHRLLISKFELAKHKHLMKKA